MGRMDARRDTPVMPCGAESGHNLGSRAKGLNVETGNLEDLLAGILDRTKTLRTAVDASRNCQTDIWSVSPGPPEKTR
jgi:hypothetical protein